MLIPLKLKYRNRNSRLDHGNEDARFKDETRVFSFNYGRGKSGGSSGGVGRKARRALRWPEGIKGRRLAI